MLVIGPISSIHDFLTFLVLPSAFQAGETLFHTDWFVESLATQNLVLLVLRTAANPLWSRASRPLAISTIIIVVVGPPCSSRRSPCRSDLYRSHPCTLACSSSSHHLNIIFTSS